MYPFPGGVFRAVFLALIALVLMAGALPAMAQSEEQAAPRATLSAEAQAELERLVGTLEDERGRAELVAQLKSLLEAQRALQPEEPRGLGSRLLAELSSQTADVSRQMVDAAAAVTDVPQLWRWTREALRDPAGRDALIRALAELALIFAGAIAVEWLVRRGLARAQASLDSRNDLGIGLTILFLLFRTLLDLVAIGAFAAAAFGALTLIDPVESVRIAAVALINASVIARVLNALARMVLVPHASGLRLLRLSDETANYAFLWFRRIVNLSVYGTFAIQALGLLGLPPAPYLALQRALGLAILLLLVMLVLQNRRSIADYIRGLPEAPLARVRRRLAEIWHVLVLVYLVAVYFVWAMDIPGGYEFVARATVLSVAIVVLARVATVVIDRIIDRAFSLRGELKLRLPGLEARANRYLPFVHSIAHGVIAVVAALGILQAWGVDIFLWFGTDTGRVVLGRSVTIALIVVIAFIVWELASAWIEAYLSGTDANGNAVQRSQRMRTLLPLARNALMIVLAVLVVLTVLSELGVNIAPLLAGAGVVGLAVGFGAQTLVKDVITGLFILIEDSVQNGDVVEAAGHAGRVEAMSIRTMRLRDLEGSVHTIPFSEVTSLKNLTKDFSYAVMDIGIAYREDVEAVIEVLKDLGREIREDPEQGPKIIADLEVLGLDRFEDSAVVVRIRLMTLPLQQWGVRRHFYRMLKRRFDDEGIEIPFPHRTIYFGVDKDGTAPPAHLRLQRQQARKDAEEARKAGASDRPESADEYPENPPDGGAPPAASSGGAG